MKVITVKYRKKKKKQILILKGLQGLGCWVQNTKELRALYKIFKETESANHKDQQDAIKSN